MSDKTGSIIIGIIVTLLGMSSLVIASVSHDLGFSFFMILIFVSSIAFLIRLIQGFSRT